ncbi:Gp15 family bacteriophage protein [uncultured Rikenella sp.]|uniref:Gp15 family bacteriophage protein n=1 Tax=uncultured Rikenella sp. TaxID=368003 RepID=UPI002603B3DE|nr:Gp15 family bacteriophage protein [uncultured Rikenella sp.]
MNYPEYVEIDGQRFKINTDFRVALKCNKIAQDDTIQDYERALAIIYLLFGEVVFEKTEYQEKFLELAQKYLSCGKEIKPTNEEPDFDFEQDMELVRISFISDYGGLDIKNTTMHFWEFMDRINGLSNSEMGNCCILNRVRNLRNFNTKNIKDPKEKKKIIEAKKQVALKKKEKKRILTEEEKNNINDFMKMAGIERE